MFKKYWGINLENQTHTITLQHNKLTNKKTLLFDGKQVLTTKILDQSSLLCFTMHDNAFKLFIDEEDLIYSYRLLMNDSSVIEETNQSDLSSLPNWAFIFIVGCILIPILLPEGQVPQLMGILGAVKCSSLSRKNSRSKKENIKSCSILVLGLWAGVLIFSFALKKFMTLFY